MNSGCKSRKIKLIGYDFNETLRNYPKSLAILDSLRPICFELSDTSEFLTYYYWAQGHSFLAFGSFDKSVIGFNNYSAMCQKINLTKPRLLWGLPSPITFEFC